MMLVSTLFWIALIVGLVWLLYRLARGCGWIGSNASPRDPKDIHRERYARGEGEIDRVTYERMREELKGDRPA